MQSFLVKIFNRSDVIRTRDLYVPNVALYQAEPHSDIIQLKNLVKIIKNLLLQILNYGQRTRTSTNRVRVCCAAITPIRISMFCFVVISRKQQGYYNKLSRKVNHFFKSSSIFRFVCFFQNILKIDIVEATASTMSILLFLIISLLQIQSLQVLSYIQYYFSDPILL